jgi:hypothetical protein
MKRSRRRKHRLPIFLALITAAAVARAEPVVIDRAAVRFVAPETGGSRSPQFIFERVLAFEARIEALADPDHVERAAEAPYRERHLTAALERHIAETLLASLRIEPEPKPQEIARQVEAARAILTQRVGGPEALARALRAEQIGSQELRRILGRQARASLYLDRMVTPMLRPNEAELRAVHRSGRTPFSTMEYAEVSPALRRWYIGRKLAEALGAFFQNARSRLRVTLLQPAAPAAPGARATRLHSDL